MEPNTSTVEPTAVATPSQETGTLEASHASAEPTAQGQPQSAVDVLEAISQANLDPSVVEEIKKGYMRQADYTRKTQGVSELKRSITGNTPNQEPPAFQGGVQDEGMKFLDQYLESKMAPVNERMAFAEFASTHPDAGDLETAMIKVIDEYPELKSTKHLNVLYELAQKRSLESKVKTAKDEGAKEALATVQAKAKTFAEPTQPTKSGGSPDVKNMSAAEIKSMLG